ncbi:MAG: diadenylate cyclase [Verrucomicrobiales bacterium]|nr:diadenylate cyclase [Verrucomicrobiales bacterium]
MSSSTSNTDSPPTEYAETRLLVKHGFELARSLGITKVLVYAELVSDQRLVETHRETETLIWITAGESPDTSKEHEFFVEVPGETNRISQVTLGVIMGVFRGVVETAESVICLTGLAGSKRLDNLLIINPKRDFPWFSNHEEEAMVPESVNLRELLQLLTISLRFASEGREGKPIGTTFVLGEVEQLKPHLRPLILNPLEGHLKKTRNVYDNKFLETLRELAALDGAFIVNPKGVVEFAAVYLDAPLPANLKIAKGLGARHVAAAAITSKADCVAVVISESSGNISVFYKGQAVMTLEGHGGGGR